MATRRCRLLVLLALAFHFCTAWLAPGWLAPTTGSSGSSGSSGPAASRRKVLGGVVGVATAPLAAGAEQLKSSWPAKDGVQFLRFYEDQYDAERDDTRRTPQFIQAIQERVKGRPGLTVLDIGTGPFALFALVAARAGAKKVYAVEGNPEAAERARNTIAEQEDVPEGVIEVIEGFSTAVTLPEKVDLVCAEVVGAFATQENIVATMQDAQRRHMKDANNPQNYIPSVVQTWTAPVSYALHPVLAPPKFEKLQGQPLTLNPRDRTLELISDPQVLEEINFAKPLPEGKQSKSLNFKISRDRLRSNYDAYYEALTTKEEVKVEDARPLATQTTKSFSGMAIWPRLILDPEAKIVVESRGPKGEHQKSHWPTLLTLMSPTPVPVEPEDTLDITETTELSKGDILVPVKYSFQGTLNSASA
eukprot:s154_g83.t2